MSNIPPTIRKLNAWRDRKYMFSKVADATWPLTREFWYDYGADDEVIYIEVQRLVDQQLEEDFANHKTLDPAEITL